MLGYPTIQNFSIKDDEPYLCVSHETERGWVQPLRLIAAFVGGPAVMMSARNTPGTLGNVAFAAGLGMSIWSLAVYRAAKREMDAYSETL